MLFTFEFTGKMPLLLHHDNIEGQDTIKDWQASKEGEGKPKGDDRWPAWTWQTYLYTDGRHITMPADNLMSGLLTAGKRTSKLQPDGRPLGKGNYEELSQTGLLIHEDHLPILTPNQPVKMKDVLSLYDSPFSVQREKVKSLGFSLYLKPVAVGKAKHKRVRPRFEEWRLEGHVEIVDAAISEAALRAIFANLGKVGLGDWRPGAPWPKKPGRFGTFDCKLKRA